MLIVGHISTEIAVNNKLYNILSIYLFDHCPYHRFFSVAPEVSNQAATRLDVIQLQEAAGTSDVLPSGFPKSWGYPNSWMLNFSGKIPSISCTMTK